MQISCTVTAQLISAFAFHGWYNSSSSYIRNFKHNSSSSYIRNFKVLALFCDCHNLYLIDYCRYNLKDHELVYHSGEMPSYACDLCPYMAQTKQKLARHKRLSHQEDLPFKCDQCELVFAQNMALLIHMKTHDEKKFECKVRIMVHVCSRFTDYQIEEVFEHVVVWA